MDLSLRERKKLQTRRLLWQTAMELFMARGYDNVSVAEIAAACDLSKMTVFNYFATKEDLVLGPMEEHLDEPARVVRERGELSPVEALRRHFLAALAERDASTGVSDVPGVLAVWRLIQGTPALRLRALASTATSEALLGDELLAQGMPAVEARLAAAQISAVRWALIAHNFEQLLAGATGDEIYPAAVRDAELGFGQLERGLRPATN